MRAFNSKRQDQRSGDLRSWYMISWQLEEWRQCSLVFSWNRVVVIIVIARSLRSGGDGYQMYLCSRKTVILVWSVHWSRREGCVYPTDAAEAPIVNNAPKPLAGLQYKLRERQPTSGGKASLSIIHHSTALPLNADDKSCRAAGSQRNYSIVATAA